MSQQGEPQEKSARAEAELGALLEAVDCAVLLLDECGTISRVNAAFLGWLELNPDSTYEGQPVENLLAAAATGPGKEFAERWGRLARPSENGLEGEIELAGNGKRVLRRVGSSVRDAAGRRIGWLEMLQEVPQAASARHNLHQTERMAALGRLVSGIAHELNNPLTGIRGYAQRLLARGLPQESAEEVRRIYQEAERTRRLVANLLLFAREKKLVRVPVNLNELVERTVALRSYERKVEGIGLNLTLESVPTTMADPHQLQQVILNLLVNAEQAILQMRSQIVGKVQATAGRIGVSTRARGDRIELRISDNGPGIPPEVASQVFDPFFTTKPPGLGTGLGLSIVYGILREHGAEIYLHSPGEDWASGTTFVIEIPVVPADGQTPLDPEQLGSLPAITSQLAPETQDTPKLASKAGGAMDARRVLVVEDEPTVARLIADVLAEDGHEAQVLLDSREALQRIRAQGPGHSFDLVICDLKMPGLNGPDFFQALTAANCPERRRIVFITGDTLSLRTREFLQRHRLPFLAKPFLVEELKRVIREFLAEETVGSVSESRPNSRVELSPAKMPRWPAKARSQIDSPSRREGEER